MKKRSWVIIILFAIITIGIAIPICFADADVTAPTIHVDTLHVSQTEATIGDKVTVSVKVTDDIAMSTDNTITFIYH